MFFLKKNFHLLCIHHSLPNTATYVPTERFGGTTGYSVTKISNVLRHVDLAASRGKTHLRYLCCPRRTNDRTVAGDDRDSEDRGRTQKAQEGGRPLLCVKFSTVTPFPELPWYWKITGTGSAPVTHFCSKAFSKVLLRFWWSRR